MRLFSFCATLKLVHTATSTKYIKECGHILRRREVIVFIRHE